ncbi:DUF6318 family protein [Georgenia sp. Z1344]|uniref:DUF6318 family protein n=1 Tax=Georgenia sp. Z1344 TaxID=3416706 RepID=UPI003CF60A38
MSRTLSPRTPAPRLLAIVPVLLLGSAALAACEGGEVVPPVEGVEAPPTAEAPATDTPTTDTPTTESPTTESPPTEDTPTDSEPRSDDPASVSVDEVEWTAWELERRGRPAPTPPAAYDENSEAGAIAAAEYFMEVLEHGYETLVPDTLAALSGPDCTYCSGRIDAWTTWSIRGTYDEDFEAEVHSIVPEPGDTDSEWGVILELTEPERTIVDSVGGFVETVRPYSSMLAIGMRWDGQGWVWESGVQI